MIGFSIRLYLSSIVPRSSENNFRLEKLTTRFANLANFVALMGGKIKSEQMISGNMSDILSNIYFCQSLIYYHNNYCQNIPIEIRDYCINKLCAEAENKINLVIDNYPNNLIKNLLKPSKYNVSTDNFKNENKIYDMIIENKNIHHLLKDNIFYENTVIEKLENLTNLKTKSDNFYKIKYNELYNDVISVGEYNNK